MIMSNFGTTVVNVKKEDISIIACWGQNLNLVDDSLSRFDRQVIEEQTCKGNLRMPHTWWVFSFLNILDSDFVFKTCIQKMIGQLCVSCHTGALVPSWSL